jgi:hypothetical protein
MMKRLLAAAALAGSALVSVAPAHATIIVCNNLPVMVSCYDMDGHRWCSVWVQAPRVVQPVCVSGVNDVLGPIGG